MLTERYVERRNLVIAEASPSAAFLSAHFHVLEVLSQLATIQCPRTGDTHRSRSGRLGDSDKTVSTRAPSQYGAGSRTGRMETQRLP